MRELAFFMFAILPSLALVMPSPASSQTEKESEPSSSDSQDVKEEEPLDGVAPRGAIFETAEEAQKSDLERAAAGRGISTADMAKLFSAQEDLDVVTSIVVDRYPELYAGGFSGGPNGPAIRIKGSVPADLDQLISRHGVEAIGGAPLSWDEMTVGVEVAADELARMGMPDSVAYLRVTELEIRAHVPHQANRNASDVRRDLVARLNARLPDHAPAHGARGTTGPEHRLAPPSRSAVRGFLGDHLMVVMEDPGVDNRAVGDHSYGGGEAQDDGVFECTTGWAINLPDAFDHLDPGGTGIVTAAHCQGLNEYDDQNTAPYSMPWVAEHVGANGDLELHRSTHIEPDDFWADDGVMRDVTGIQALNNIDEDDSVCVYGRATDDRDCSADVMTAFGCSMPDHRQACGMVITDIRVAFPGDSGGGWSWSNTAWGVHSGSPTVGGVVRNSFTPVARLGDQWAGGSIRQ